MPTCQAAGSEASTRGPYLVKQQTPARIRTKRTAPVTDVLNRKPKVSKPGRSL